MTLFVYAFFVYAQHLHPSHREPRNKDIYVEGDHGRASPRQLPGDAQQKDSSRESDRTCEDPARGSRMGQETCIPVADAFKQPERMKAQPCNDYFVQPPWPKGFGGTAPMRCASYEKGPHVWLEGGLLDDGTLAMYECKVCGRGGDDCPACGDGWLDDGVVDPDCTTCCGTGIIPV